MELTEDKLPNDIQELKRLLISTQKKYDNLLEQFKLAQQRQYVASTEKNILQGELFDEPSEAEAAEEGAPTETVVAAHTRQQKPKRQPIPDHFPREVIRHDIDDAEKRCDCGCEKICFGEEVSEQLDIIPPQIKVIQHVRPKYVCKSCESHISMAPMPWVLLPKSIASAGLVAYTITNKYVDHIPLYRQEAIWQRYGIDIPRSSCCDWILKTAELCEPLIKQLTTHILKSGYVQADETPVQVMKEAQRKNTQKSYMWVYRGGDANNVGVVYEYQETRAAAHPKLVLESFEGYLQTDGYKGYDWVSDKDDIVHLACMAHARRPFAELVKMSKKVGKSHQAVALIGQLYHVEAKARHLNPWERKALRGKEAKPILDKLKAWLEKSIKGSPPKGKLGNAIKYMLDRWGELNHYLLDGRLEIDNNLIENAIRPFAIGKKNWLFAGSPRGAKASATLYSLIMTCKANDIDPYAYFRYMLDQLRTCSSDEDYNALLPFNIDKSVLRIN